MESSYYDFSALRAAPNDWPASRPVASPFAGEWFVLVHSGGVAPTLSSFPFAAAGLRNALSDQAGPALDVSRLAIVPLADVGAATSSGTVRGIALVARRGPKYVPALTRALAALRSRENAQAGVRIACGPAAWFVTPSTLPPPASDRWLGYGVQERQLGAYRWASVTPLMLGPLRTTTETWRECEHRIRGLVEKACVELGLPRPARVFSSPVSPLQGTRAVPPQRRARTLTHAVLEFGVPITGPLILGSGSSLGLGLCLPFGSQPHARVRTLNAGVR